MEISFSNEPSQQNTEKSKPTSKAKFDDIKIVIKEDPNKNDGMVSPIVDLVEPQPQIKKYQLEALDSDTKEQSAGRV